MKARRKSEHIAIPCRRLPDRCPSVLSEPLKSFNGRQNDAAFFLPNYFFVLLVNLCSCFQKILSFVAGI
jgi:hypothetical protein